MNYFSRDERLEILDGQLCRIVTAYGKDRAHKGESMDVMRHFEDGRKEIRNIEYVPGSMGWLIAWPGYNYTTICRGYVCGSGIAELDPWYKIDYEMKGFSCHHPTDEEKELILQKYPEFKWIFKKANLTTEEIFHILPEWKKNPQQVELLFGAGFPLLAKNKSIYKLKNTRPILEWLRNHPNMKYVTLAEIQKCIKWNITIEQLDEYTLSNRMQARLDYDCWLHWKNVLVPKKLKKETPRMVSVTYHDYLKMAKKAGHNINDKYWRFPKNVRQAHDKVMKEIEAIEAARKSEKMAKENVEYQKAIQKMVKKQFTTGKIKVYIPKSIEQIDFHAEVLHQCLMRMDYPKRVCDGKIWLVFIEKAGKPYATCELIRNGKKLSIGQFYGDEHLADYKAKKDAKQAFNEWAKANKIKAAA